MDKVYARGMRKYWQGMRVAAAVPSLNANGRDDGKDYAAAECSAWIVLLLLAHTQENMDSDPGIGTYLMPVAPSRPMQCTLPS